MFTQSFIEYSLVKIIMIIRETIENKSDIFGESILPTTMNTNNVKCLDYDMDKVVFKKMSKSPINLAEINPYYQSKVMDMV